VRLGFSAREHLFVECGDGAAEAAGNSSTSVCPMISAAVLPKKAALAELIVGNGRRGL